VEAIESMPEDNIIIVSSSRFETLLILGALEADEIAHEKDVHSGSYNTIEKNALCSCAEICYWLNRPDLTPIVKKENCKSAWQHLQKEGFPIAVAVLWESFMTFRNHDIEINLSKPLVSIGDFFPEEIAGICRLVIKNPEQNESLFEYHNKTETVPHAFNLLSKFGNIVDLPLIKELVNDPEYGRSAIHAVKRPEQKL
jgi:hypothetical protein